ncbi:MAG: TRAP transporter small permease subunit [Alphaproteobacteria bacterium]|nr:MAG: TRAP transporter small permease subunit [Alphaproteobacteria bacterium]
MPSLTFILPHWLYWSGLVLFPLVAFFMVRRQAAAKFQARATNLPVAYLLWLFGGFVGLHRFYVRSFLGAVYIPLFIAILFGNSRGRQARDQVSGARNDLMGAKFDAERFQEAAKQGRDSAQAMFAKAEQAVAATQDQFAAATADFEQWQMVSGGFAIAIAVLLAIDAVALPWLVRRCTEREGPAGPMPMAGKPPAEVIEDVTGPAAEVGPTRQVHSRITGAIDKINGFSGEFVCYWSVIAVFVYYYEVIARYVFNSPTNWAHESMFLMFGMQYLLSGAYALREQSHVRVDVLYAYLSDRAKVITDIVTSAFFFIFTGALLVTGWIFFRDSIDVWEVSFTEWGIQYWPIKFSLVLGAVLIILQGLSKLIKDVVALTRMGA